VPPIGRGNCSHSMPFPSLLKSGDKHQSLLCMRKKKRKRNEKNNCNPYQTANQTDLKGDQSWD
jgi:hypothetical protein